jgi:hypothetical protein
MDLQTATYIQTGAAIVQALASAAFLWGVLRDRKAREQYRRAQIIERLLFVWTQTADQPRAEELAGIFSQRQITFFNERLNKLGEKWRYKAGL